MSPLVIKAEKSAPAGCWVLASHCVWCTTVSDDTRVREEGLARRQDHPLKTLQCQRGHDDRHGLKTGSTIHNGDTHVLTATYDRCEPAKVDPTTAITALHQHQH